MTPLGTSTGSVGTREAEKFNSRPIRLHPCNRVDHKSFLCVNVDSDVKRATQLALAAVAIVLIAIPLAFLVVGWSLGSALEGFGGPLIAIDEEAESRIRDEFGNWIGEDVRIRQCAFAVVGIVSDTGEHAVFSGDRADLIEIAESFSGQSIAEFDRTYQGDDFAVLELKLEFPTDRLWAPAQITNGRFFEFQNWTSKSHGTGKFVAIDYDTSQIYLLKWTE